jgi:Carboxypeptidase regulatory-like domain
MRGRLVSSVAAFTASIALAHIGGAQGLAGTIRDSVSRLPVPGVVVILLDSAGGTIARRLTNERGEFRIAVPDAARVARFVRIGFTPREVPVPLRSEANTSFDVSMLALPSMIKPVRVLANSRCRPRKDRADALGLWEQARAGLLATIVAREENPARMLRLGFDKVMDGNSDRIRMMRVQPDSADTAAVSFVAAYPAKDFVRLGFTSDTLASGTNFGGTYFGPDADVLLDDSFAGAYCFELVDGRSARRGQVGLRFLPADRRKGRVDIDGTLWIDTVARELRDVEFQYLNVAAGAVGFRPGGYVSFRSMKNGVVLIDRWSIRLVSASRDTTVDAIGGLSVRDRLYAEEDGGELARAAWPDGLTWRAPLGALRVHAIMKDGKAAVGAVIGLVATHYYGTVGTNGMVEIKDLLPGPYAVRIIDPRIATLGIGLPTPLKFRAARDTTTTATLVVPTTESSIADRCVANHQWTAGDSVFTIGRVVKPDGKPVNDAKVTFATRPDSGQQWQWNNVYFTTGTDGLFEFCHSFGVGTEILYHVARGGVLIGAASGKFTSGLLVVRMPVPPLK